MASGISGQVVSATLIALPMKVPTAGLSSRKCGLRNLSSSMTTGNSVSRMRHAVFHLLGGFPVTGSFGTQPGNDVSTRCAWKPCTRASLSLTMAARASDLSQPLEMRRRVEAQHRGPARLVMLRRLHERADIAGKRRLELLDAVGPGAIGRFLAGLDVGDHHHGHAVPHGIFDRRLADELHHQAAFDERRDLLDQPAMLLAAPPLAQRIDRGEARDDHGFELIRRRRRPELDAQRAGGEHRGLPADLPLRRTRSSRPGRMRAQSSSVEGSSLTLRSIAAEHGRQTCRLPRRRC